MLSRKCTVEGCDKPYRSSGWCEMHYGRWLRNGDPLVVLKVHDHPETCTIEGCDKLYLTKGLCNMHYIRQCKHGDPHTVLPPRGGSPPGPEHPFWRGDEISYGGMHQRIYRYKGSATTYECGCGTQAAQWAYTYDDPYPQVDALGRVYSINLDCYEPLCVPCHKMKDFHHKTATKFVN